ncbi:MAG: type II toxin-antitoxin system prevent-host-death family antitoxin [Caldilineaceae bacterium]|nr:type II toxin-antitoxin system prevent-host-death family antitoxin [Caldilineaceae bacterium]MDE0631574.1 type II toxin-antitoxin system prevent-host-death family antitoxin [Caldilineaceae bacterium]MXZ19624.1 type II toxin-antitoxin system prevent-host-death family antitoxin [Caldilineaceae bacterium SB0665_bin_25]
MQTTSITHLKNSLSAYLRNVKAGEEVLITDRGRPIARLVPVTRSESMEERLSIEEHLEDLERRGLLRRGTGKLPEGFWDMPRMEDPEGLVLKGLLQEREEGR